MYRLRWWMKGGEGFSADGWPIHATRLKAGERAKALLAMDDIVRVAVVLDDKIVGSYVRSTNGKIRLEKRKIPVDTSMGVE